MQPYTPRTLDQIMSSLGSVYDPQIASNQQQQAEIPGQISSEEQGLAAKQSSAFDSILGGARERGVGFGGIPLGEQAKYTATDYLPALANLHTAAKQQITSLQDAINQIYERRNSQAQDLFNSDRSYGLEVQKQIDAEKAAALAASNSNSNPFPPKDPKVTAAVNPLTVAGVKAKSSNPADGFAFTDLAGNPVSAGTWAALHGVDVGDLLLALSQKGDKYANQAYNEYITNKGTYGDDFRNKYSALFWAGTGSNAAPAPPAATQPGYSYSSTGLVNKAPSSATTTASALALRSALGLK